MQASSGTDTKEDAAQPPAVPGPKPARRKLSLALLNFWLDAALLVAVVFLVWVSVLLQFAFPAPTAAAGWQLWGLDYNRWHDLQFYALCVCTLLALERLVLHWNWVCSVLATQVLRVKAKPDEGVQAVYGVGVFIAVLVVVFGSLIAAILTVKPPPL
jgi:hypothetical protein